jgi:ABC-2 type transport system ATP-binding protein
VIVDAKQVTKTFGLTNALDRVTLTVEQGTVHGLVGPNGAGKTTMLNLMAGLASPTSGSVNVATATIGVLPDTPLFERWLTGREVVALALSLSEQDTAESKVDEILDVVDLGKDKNRRVRGYSRGMLQRLGLAATFVSEPELLLLDEPAAALDPLGRRDVLDLIRELRGTSTVVFSSHILDDVQEVCDTIGILSSGRLVYEGSLDRLLATTSTVASYAIELRSGATEFAALIAQREWVMSAEASSDTDILVTGADTDTLEANLVPWLGTSGYIVIGVTPVRRSLEDVFLEVTR